LGEKEMLTKKPVGKTTRKMPSSGVKKIVPARLAEKSNTKEKNSAK
jgi:hypothetical protein